MLPICTLILTGVIGIVTLYIAYQQYRTAKNKLRLDLFDRRLPVFESCNEVSCRAYQESRSDSPACTAIHQNVYVASNYRLLDNALK